MLHLLIGINAQEGSNCVFDRSDGPVLVAYKAGQSHTHIEPLGKFVDLQFLFYLFHTLAIYVAFFICVSLILLIYLHSSFLFTYKVHHIASARFINNCSFLDFL